MKHGSKEEHNLMETLGRNIKQQLKAGGTKQKELARMMGLHDSDISAYIHAKREPGLYRLKGIADALGVAIDDLLR